MGQKDYESWLALDTKQRAEVFFRLNPYEEHEVFTGVAAALKEWSTTQAEVVQAFLGNNHGSMEIRVIWKDSVTLNDVPTEFLGVPVRNLHHGSVKEVHRSLSYSFSQILITLFLLPIGLLCSAVYSLFFVLRRRGK